MDTQFIPRKERTKSIKHHSQLTLTPQTPTRKKKHLTDNVLNRKEINRELNVLFDSLSKLKPKLKKKKPTYTSRSEKNKKRFKLSFIQILVICFIILIFSTPYILL